MKTSTKVAGISLVGTLATIAVAVYRVIEVAMLPNDTMTFWKGAKLFATFVGTDPVTLTIFGVMAIAITVVLSQHYRSRKANVTKSDSSDGEPEKDVLPVEPRLRIILPKSAATWHADNKTFRGEILVRNDGPGGRVSRIRLQISEFEPCDKKTTQQSHWGILLTRSIRREGDDTCHVGESAKFLLVTHDSSTYSMKLLPVL